MNVKYHAYTQYQFGNIFGSVVKQQILQFLTNNSDKKYSVQEIANELSLNQSSVSKPLNQLESGGLLESSKEGKYKYYRLKNEYVTHFNAVYSQLKEVHAAALRDSTKN